MKKCLVLLLASLVTACASIPLGTLLRFASYDWEDVVATEASEVRAALLLPADVVVDTDSPALGVELADDNGAPTFSGTARLALQESGRFVGEPLPRADQDATWYVFALDDDGISQFRQFQRRVETLREAGGDPSVTLAVKWRFEQVGERKTVPVSIWLKLDDADGWFALAKNAELELGKRHEFTD